MDKFSYASPKDGEGSRHPAQFEPRPGGSPRRRNGSDQPDEGVSRHAEAGRECERDSRTARRKNGKGLGVDRSRNHARRSHRKPDDPRTKYPSLYEAAMGITSPQIRNMGTVAGDLCQRPRCWYYRNGYGLLAMDNGKALVPNGENRFHAIMDNSGPAYFVSPSSLGPALVAMGAKVKAVSSSGAREIPAADFFVKPASDAQREISLKPNELVTAILVPEHPGTNVTYEIRERMAMDWPLAAASIVLKMNGGKISQAKVVLGHVAPTPFAATAADQFLAGKLIDEKTAEDAGRQAVESAKPLSQNAYKVRLAQVAVKRALLQAGGKA